jgi:hypothetical protein
VREAREVLKQAIDRWNSSDREGWAALYTDDVVYQGPGATRITGLADLKAKYFDALSTAAPDSESKDVVLYADRDHVVEEARYTAPTRAPGAIPVASRFPQPDESWTSPSSASSASRTARSARSASTTTKSRFSPSSD